MSELEQTAADAADATIRIPAGVMGLLRQSYDSREKVLDWMLAIGVAATMVYVFRDELRGMIAPPADPNAGLANEPCPNGDLAGAFPANGRKPELYTYNMPVSRAIRYSVGPAMAPPPANPSRPPAYPE